MSIDPTLIWTAAGVVLVVIGAIYKFACVESKVDALLVISLDQRQQLADHEKRIVHLEDKGK